MNGSHEIRALSHDSNTDRPFVHQRITYYPGMTLAQLPKVLSKRYKYFVLDFGSPNPHTVHAFERCDICLVVGPICPWKTKLYMKSVREIFYSTKKKEEIVYLGNFMERKRDLLQVSKQCGIRVIPIPFLPNPFRITSEHFTFFNEILGGN